MPAARDRSLGVTETGQVLAWLRHRSRQEKEPPCEGHLSGAAEVPESEEVREEG